MAESAIAQTTEDFGGWVASTSTAYAAAEVAISVAPL
jgi:hypothetical protein